MLRARTSGSLGVINLWAMTGVTFDPRPVNHAMIAADQSLSDGLDEIVYMVLRLGAGE